MDVRRRLALALVLTVGFGCARSRTETTTEAAKPQATAAAPKLDVPYDPSPPEAVDTMLRLAQVTPNDVVYDLGCGDGRVVIAAVKRHGARGVCVDLDPQRIREARANANAAGVADKIAFLTQDLFATDLSNATVVMLFLWPEVNLKLRPKLLREVRAGARVVSHWHDMGDWKPEQTVRIAPGGQARFVYLWTIPEDTGRSPSAAP
jgi:predicted O-methyltransferase YrrM